jgi:hypothetical protein
LKINGKEPDPDPELELTIPDPGARTRQAAEPLNLVYKYARTEVRRKSCRMRVAEPWNKFSKETRESRNVQQFKRMLKNEWIKSKAEKKTRNPANNNTMKYRAQH